MSLEESMNELAAAMRELSAKLAASPAAAAATPAARGPGRPPKAKIGIAEVKAIADKLLAEKGKPVAVALINRHGAPRLAEMDESKYAAFIAAAEVLLNEEDEPVEEIGAEL